MLSEIPSFGNILFTDQNNDTSPTNIYPKSEFCIIDPSSKFPVFEDDYQILQSVLNLEKIQDDLETESIFFDYRNVDIIKKDDYLNLNNPMMKKKIDLNNGFITPKDKEIVNARRKTMSEMKKTAIERFMEERLLTKDYNFCFHGTRYEFVNVSCKIFDANNRIRLYILWFLTSKYNSLIAFLFSLLNLMSFFLTDYRYRIDTTFDNSLNNLARNKLEIICYSYFTFEVLIHIIGYGLIQGKKTFFRQKWKIFSFIWLLLAWASFIEENIFSEFFLCIRLLGPLRIILIVKELKRNLENIVRACISTYKFYPGLLLLIIFYAVVGIYLFYGFNENRCRIGNHPHNNEWEIIENNEFYCGDTRCIIGTCGNLAEFGLKEEYQDNLNEELLFGFLNFSDFFHAFYIVLQFTLLTGWSQITYNFTRTTNKIVSNLYFHSLLIFAFLIFLSALLANMFSNFLFHSTIKTKLEIEIKRKTLLSSSKFRLSSFNALSLQEFPAKQKKSSVGIGENYFNFLGYQTKLKLMIEASEKQPGFIKKFNGKLANFFHFNSFWLTFLHLLVILNIIVLSMDRYPISDHDRYILELIHFLIFNIFFFEIASKIIVYRPQLFFKSILNCIDFFIIMLSFIAYLYQLSHESKSFENFLLFKSQEVSILKTFTVFRIFRAMIYSRFYKSSEILFKALVFSLYRIRYFIFIFIILIFVISLIGMQLFAYKIRYESEKGTKIAKDFMNGFSPTQNFDTFQDAITTIFLILYNEEWHIFMFQHYVISGYKAFIFFLIVIFFGYLVCMTLQSALFLDCFIKFIRKKLLTKQNSKSYSLKEIFSLLLKKIGSKSPKIVEDKHPKRKAVLLKLSTLPDKRTKINMIRSSIVRPINTDDLIHSSTVNPFLLKSIIPKKKSNKGKDHIKIKIKGTSKLKKIVYHRFFRFFFSFLTFASMIIITLDTPLLPNDDDLIFVLNKINIVLFCLFSIEAFLKIRVYGFVNFYFSRSLFEFWELLYLIIHFGSLLENRENSRVLQTFKIIGTFRLMPFLIYLYPEIPHFKAALIHSIPNICKILGFYMVFIYIFSLFALKYLKGTLYSCSFPMIHEEEHEFKINSKTECFDLGGDLINADVVYDNIWLSFFSLFQITTSEGWSVLMNQAIQTPNLNFVYNNNSKTSLRVFFLFFFWFCRVLLLNMFIGVVYENIVALKEIKKGEQGKNEEQKEWDIIRQNILKIRPKKKKKIIWKNSKCLCVLEVFKSKIFNYLINFTIISNAIILMMFHHRQTKEFEEIIRLLNIIFLSILGFKFIIELISYGINYLKKYYILYDLFVLIISYINIGINNDIQFKYTDISYHNYRFFKAFAVALQLSKVMDVLLKLKEISQIFITLKNILKIFIALLILIIIILFMFSIVALNYFPYIKTQKILNGIDIHFRTFSYALLGLVRIASSESWFTLTSDLFRGINVNFICEEISTYSDFLEKGFNGCGDRFGYFFFFVFHLTFSIIFFNIFIGTIITAYDDEAKAQKSAISRYQLLDIRNLWNKYDPYGYGFINYKDFWNFSSEVAILLGVKADELLDLRNKKNFLKILHIPIYCDRENNIFCYKFHDVIIELSKMSVAIKFGVINLDSNTNRENEEDENKKFIKKMNKFKKTPFFSGDMVAILILQRKIKHWLSKKVKKVSVDILKIHQMQRIVDILKKYNKNEIVPKDDDNTNTDRTLLTDYK